MTVEISIPTAPSTHRQNNGLQPPTCEAVPATLVLPQPGSESSTGLDLGIAVLSYNTEALLRNCLRSVLASQGRFRYQLCVVDNGSTDASAAMVEREFPQVKL